MILNRGLYSRRLKLHLCATAVLIAPLFLAEGAHAQTSVAPPTSDAPSDKNAVQEVIVTAAKRSQRLQDVPASIVAETGLTLEHRGAVQLSDIISNTPGVSNPGVGGSLLSNITIRGVATGANGGLAQSTVAQLYDDIPLDPEALPGTTNLRLVDMDRVEVLRGPQGTLFGSGSLAGAIRYVTNKPIMNQYSGAAEATLAGTETGASSYNGTLTVNVPLITDKLAVRASGYDFHDGGWIDDLSDGRKDINRSTSYGGRVTLRAQPVERLTADLTVMYQRAEDYAQGDSLYAAPSNTGQSGQVTYGRSEPHVIGENTIIGFDLKYNLDNVSLFSQTVYHDRNVREVGSDNYFVPLVTAIATGFSNIVQGPDNIHVPEESKNFTQEFRASSNGSGPFKWTVGAFYLHADLNTGQENRSPLVTPYVGGDAIVDVSAPGHQSEVAGFGEATYTLANKLDLTAGLRVSQTDIRYHVVTGGFIPVGTTAASAYVTENFHENDTPVNPHFSVTYRMTPDFSIYAAAARGFRVGGINETSGVGGRASPPSYGPDSLWNYEGGAKGRLFDGRLTYSADIYYIDWTNIQVNLQNNLGNYTGNAGGATLYGFEGQFDAKPVDWLQLGASVSISHNTLNTDTPGLVTAVGVITAHKGDLLPASPESQFSAYAEYDFTLLAHSGYLRINGNYIGSEYLGFAKTGSEFGDYSELDLRAGMHFDRYELIVFANNLLNSQGKQSAAEAVSVGPVVLGDQSAYRIRPLTVGVTVRAKF